MEAIEFSAVSHSGFGAASIRAPIARAYFLEDLARLREFQFVLCNGHVSNPDEDSAALLLRDRILREAAKGSGMAGESRRSFIYLLTQHALWSFVERRGIKVLRAVENDLWPLPE
jgi:hypothetical protein